MGCQLDHQEQHIVLAPKILRREHVRKKHDHVHEIVGQREHIAKKHVLGWELREHVDRHLPGPHVFLLREHVGEHVMLTKTHVMESILVGNCVNNHICCKICVVVSFSSLKSFVFT